MTMSMSFTILYAVASLGVVVSCQQKKALPDALEDVPDAMHEVCFCYECDTEDPVGDDTYVARVHARIVGGAGCDFVPAEGSGSIRGSCTATCTVGKACAAELRLIATNFYDTGAEIVGIGLVAPAVVHAEVSVAGRTHSLSTTNWTKFCNEQWLPLGVWACPFRLDVTGTHDGPNLTPAAALSFSLTPTEPGDYEVGVQFITEYEGRCDKLVFGADTSRLKPDLALHVVVK